MLEFDADLPADSVETVRHEPAAVPHAELCAGEPKPNAVPIGTVIKHVRRGGQHDRDRDGRIVAMIGDTPRFRALLPPRFSLSEDVTSFVSSEAVGPPGDRTPNNSYTNTEVRISAWYASRFVY